VAALGMASVAPVPWYSSRRRHPGVAETGDDQTSAGHRGLQQGDTRDTAIRRRLRRAAGCSSAGQASSRRSANSACCG
jgi:hypothetical protein